jgi:2-C-methyl-D-erythritol 4-phosphate cytidylyltransferase
LGAGSPAAFVRVGGVSLVVRAVRTLVGSGVVDRISVLVNAQDVPITRELLSGDSAAVTVLAQEQFRARPEGTAEPLSNLPDIVLVHEVRHALTPSALVAELVGQVRSGARAVVPVMAVSDTIKQVDARGAVLGTADRSELRLVQSPVAFDGSLLGELGSAVLAGGARLLDEIGARVDSVRAVPGSPLAFAVHTPWELELAELLVNA